MGVIFFVYGIVMGSFFNVIIYRLPNDIKILDKSRSKCTSCNSILKWWQLIPILSYVFLRGRCKCCNKKISLIYPIIELSTGMIFLIPYLKYGYTAEAIYVIVFFTMLLLVGVIDLQTKYIIDAMLIIYLVLGIILQIVLGMNIKLSLINGVISFLGYYVVYATSKKFYGYEAFGMGDVLYIGVVGFFLNNTNPIYIIFMPFYISLFMILIYKIATKTAVMKLEVPFGPSISIMGVVMTMYGSKINEIVEKFLY